LSKPKLVAICTPTLTKPTDPYLQALEAAIPPIKAAGWEDVAIFEVGNPYISAARAIMLRKALDTKPDAIVFLDYDLSWRPEDLLKLIETPGDVVAGLYRFKTDDAEAFMGVLETDAEGRPMVREDGCIRANRIPAGFLKITPTAVHLFMEAYPHLCFGPKFGPSVDIFNHGAHEGIWYGEDYAFSRNWIARGGELWVVPDLDLTHHGADGTAYPGNFHQYLRRQPGGDLAEG
jgi:hypothetical protein